VFASTTRKASINLSCNYSDRVYIESKDKLKKRHYRLHEKKIETQTDITVDVCWYKDLRSRLLAAARLVSVPQDGGLGDHGGDDVGVHVGRRPAVLEVALALLLRVAPNADGRAAVRNALQNSIQTVSMHHRAEEMSRPSASRACRYYLPI
jgi:hypothetical protein